jgi:chromate transporter
MIVADEVVELLTMFLTQSLLAIGGTYVVLGEMYRVVVTNGGWMTDAEFTGVFALAQVSPGPNTLFVTLIGWHMGGVPLGLAATLAFMLPSGVLAAVAARMWVAWGERRWFRILRRGIVPLTIGLMISSSLLLTGAATGSEWTTLIYVVGGMALSLTTRLPPVAVLGMAAAVGALGLF